MKTTPAGEVTTIQARLAEILDRDGEASIGGQFTRLAASELAAAVGRIDAMAANVLPPTDRELSNEATLMSWRFGRLIGGHVKPISPSAAARRCSSSFSPCRPD